MEHLSKYGMFSMMKDSEFLRHWDVLQDANSSAVHDFLQALPWTHEVSEKLVAVRRGLTCLVGVHLPRDLAEIVAFLVVPVVVDTRQEDGALLVEP